MNVETALKLPKFIFQELDLEIPQVIQFGLQPYFFDYAYGLYLSYIMRIVITNYAKSLYA